MDTKTAKSPNTKRKPPIPKKSWPQKPTLRQKRVAKILLEKGWSVSAAMVEAGYSENTARVPSKLTDSQGFREIFNSMLPDASLIQSNIDLLEAHEGIEKKFSADTEDEDIAAICEGLGLELVGITKDVTGLLKIAHVKKPDHQYRAKGLDLAYKVRGVTNEEKAASVDLVGFFQGAMRLRMGGNATINPVKTP